MNYPSWASSAIQAHEDKEAESQAAQELFKEQENEKRRKLLRIALISAGIAEPELDITNPVTFDEFSFEVKVAQHEPMYVLEIISPTYYYDSLRPRDRVLRRIDLCHFDQMTTVIAFGAIQYEGFIVTVGEILKAMLEKVEEGKARYEEYKSRPKLTKETEVTVKHPWDFTNQPKWPGIK